MCTSENAPQFDSAQERLETMIEVDTYFDRLDEYPVISLSEVPVFDREDVKCLLEAAKDPCCGSDDTVAACELILEQSSDDKAQIVYTELLEDLWV